ncbi:MAG: hypothetical protein MHPSP_000713, partial [Paramarteilia canceri]
NKTTGYQRATEHMVKQKLYQHVFQANTFIAALSICHFKQTAAVRKNDCMYGHWHKTDLDKFTLK